MPPEGASGAERPAKRSPDEIEREIGAAREALGDSVASLRRQVQATRAKVLSARTFAVAGSALASVIALRVRRRRRRRRG